MLICTQFLRDRKIELASLYGAPHQKIDRRGDRMNAWIEKIVMTRKKSLTFPTVQKYRMIQGMTTHPSMSMGNKFVSDCYIFQLKHRGEFPINLEKQQS